MIKVEKPDPPPPRYVDPEESLAGKCMTCGTLVSCTMMDAQRPGKKPVLGAWTDLVSAECPKCGARVFMMPAGDLKPLVEKSH